MGNLPQRCHWWHATTLTLSLGACLVGAFSKEVDFNAMQEILNLFLIASECTSGWNRGCKSRRKCVYFSILAYNVDCANVVSRCMRPLPLA
eukprot:2188245-Amphidinium_carterae.3